MAEWRDVIGHEATHAVSSEGAVVSKKSGKQVTPQKEHEYTRVALCGGGKRRYVLVHRLVAAAFLGPPPDGMEINHKDGNKRNNRVDNLEYVTHIHNMRHAVDFLGHHRGDSHPRAKLTSEDVLEIRRDPYRGPGRTKRLAAKFGVVQRMVRDILNRKRWGHLPCEE